MSLRFSKWVPLPARERLQEILESGSSSPQARELVKRLSTHQAMRSFWKELPDNPKGRQAVIIGWIVSAYERATGLKPRLPRLRADAAKYLAKYSVVEPTAEMISVLIQQALADMEEWQTHARYYWSSLWIDDPRIDYDQLVKILSAAVDFYNQLEVQVKSDVASMVAEFRIPPPPRKLRSVTAGQTYFSQIMSAVLLKVCGTPKDDLVATVTAVAFDLPDDISSETVRGRRRPRSASLTKRR